MAAENELVGRLRLLASALISALLARLTVPPFDLSPLALIAWVPLLMVAKRERLRAVLVAAAVQGVVLDLSAHTWLVEALEHSLSLSRATAVVGWLGLGLIQGLRAPLVFGLVALGVRFRCPLWLSFPAVQVVVEAVFPALFPWTLALQVHDAPAWLQAASLSGSSAVTLWLCVVNAWLAETVLLRRERSRAGARLGLAVALVAAVSWFGRSQLALAELAERQAPRARVIVGHVGSQSDEPADPIPALRERTLALVEREPQVDLVVWPETVLSTPTSLRDLPALARDYLLRDRAQGSRGRQLQTPLLLGLVLNDHGLRYNSALLVGRAGTVLGRYDKQVLVPLGETSRALPALPELGGAVPVVNPFSTGQSREPMVVGGQRVTVTICYEDILPDFVRARVLRDQPAALINITSDAWFKGTVAPEFHLALAKLRSVEHRKYSVRATREGVSAIIDSGGRARQRVEGPAIRAFAATVPWLTGATPFTRHGALGSYVLIGLSLGVWAGWRIREKSRGA